ncbi:MAG: D-2-hydroxyacid dehydrogenase [Acidimicrobiia bacterium]|nr:D-2-hydroxyacid dehydrogenase [Acidimicrobiia bacterium]
MPLTLLVLSKPEAAHLRLLEALPDEVRIVTGNQHEIFAQVAPEADAILNGFVSLDLFRDVFLQTKKLRWIHSLSAGVENTLFPELIESPVPLTNASGVFSRSLAEFVIAGALYFDKKIQQMQQNQKQGRWVNMDVDELHGKTMGIVSYGSIGRACAKLARAFGMKVLATRRRPELCDGDELVDKAYAPSQVAEMMAASDFVVICSPLTPSTRGLIGPAELAAMKPSAILMNVGRGPVVVEDALIAVLREGKIRGAALDVFDKEPLPEGHPFYSMENVLLSPHSADHTPGWTEASMQFFIENFGRFHRGQPLLNIVNKREGY